MKSLVLLLTLVQTCVAVPIDAAPGEDRTSADFSEHGTNKAGNSETRIDVAVKLINARSCGPKRQLDEQLVMNRHAGDEPLSDAAVTHRFRLRVLSYNIHHAAGVDARLDVERIAKVILSVKPDIVALQEVDKGVERSKRADQPAELARLTKMNVVFGKNINFGGGEYGNAVLSRFPIGGSTNHKLPNIDDGEQRGVLDVTLRVPDGRVRLLATHFDHRRDEAERRASAEAVNRLLEKDRKLPTLLAGDLNAVPTSDTLKTLERSWKLANKKESFTVPVKEPKRQIDYVLFAPVGAWSVIETRVLPEATASDHRAILAVLEVTPMSGRGVSGSEKEGTGKVKLP